MAAIRIIKKYPNRRLYDTEISSYVTIEDVRQLIVDGEKFEVRDAKTGQDLTRLVLLQIISEQEQDGEPVLSVQMLSQIIQFYGDSLQEFMGNYLEHSLQLFIDQQAQFRQQLSPPLSQKSWPLINQFTEHNLTLWQDFQRNFTNTLNCAAAPTATQVKTKKSPARVPSKSSH